MKDNFFTLYPAIDIKGGKCVRLLFGDMEKETIYNNNPLDQAMWFVDQGAEWLHIVDLDGAVAGKNINKRVIEKILQKLQNKVKIQIGGGIRNIDDIDQVTYYASGNPSLSLVGSLRHKVKLEIENQKLRRSGLDQSVLDQLKANLEVNSINLTDSGERESSSIGASIVGYISGFLIYMFIFKFIYIFYFFFIGKFK